MDRLGRPVFVYGTLMRGQRASHMLCGAVYGGKAQLKDYAMYHLGRYPGIVACPGETVFGELYYVSEAMLAQMDEYEEEGRFVSSPDGAGCGRKRPLPGAGLYL